MHKDDFSEPIKRFYCKMQNKVKEVFFVLLNIKL